MSDRLKNKRKPLTARIFFEQFKHIADGYPDSLVEIDGKILSQATWAKTNILLAEIHIEELIG